MEVNQRVRDLMKALTLEATQFARALGHNRPDKIYNIENDKTKTSTDILEDITKTFERVNGDWLLTGRGNMFLDSIPSKPRNDLSTLLEEKEARIVELKERIAELKEALKDCKELLKK